MPVYTWSSTAASNGTIDTTINFQEGQAPSTVNNSARAMMAAVAQYRDDIGGALATTGTGTAYVLTTNSGFTSTTLMANQQICFVPNVTNTGACTINVDGLGAIPLHLFPGVNLPSGTIVQGTPYAATYYSGANEFILRGNPNPFSVPLGGMIEYIGSTAPNSAFVLPYAQAISRTVYATLFSLISTTYGAGDGSTTFNVPDLRGCVVACPDNMGGTAASRLTAFGGSGTTIGAIGGAQSNAIAQANLPNVSFTGGALSVSASGSYSGTTSYVSNDHTHTFSGTTGGMNGNDPHNHSISFSNTPLVSGSGAGFGGGGAYGIAGSASIGSTSINHGHAYSGTTSGISANHTHTYSGSVSVGGSTSGQSVSSGGSGTALGVVQPTIILPRILRVL